LIKYIVVLLFSLAVFAESYPSSYYAKMATPLYQADPIFSQYEDLEDVKKSILTYHNLATSTLKQGRDLETKKAGKDEIKAYLKNLRSLQKEHDQIMRLFSSLMMKAIEQNDYVTFKRVVHLDFDDLFASDSKNRKIIAYYRQNSKQEKIGRLEQLIADTQERDRYDQGSDQLAHAGNSDQKEPIRYGRFWDYGEYIFDRETGLNWQKDGKASGKRNFYEAQKYAKSLELGGKRGWRVPTAKELASIFPALEVPFTNTPYTDQPCCKGPYEWPSYWTSQLDKRLDDYAYIYQWYGKGGKNNCYASRNYAYVRCVHY
jgi:hypothetical protein